MTDYSISYSELWQRAKDLSDELDISRKGWWPIKEDTLKTRLRYMDDIKEHEEKEGRKYEYVISYTLTIKNTETTREINEKYLSPNKNLNEQQILQIKKEEKTEKKNYDKAEITKFKLLSSKRFIPITNLNNIPLFKCSLIYNNFGTVPDLEQQGKCVYDAFKEKYNIDENDIKKIINKNIKDGLTLNDIKKIVNYYKIAIYIIDLYGELLFKNQLDSSIKGKERKPETFMIANEHLYMIDDEHRKEIINKHRLGKMDVIPADIINNLYLRTKTTIESKIDRLPREVEKFPDVLTDIHDREIIYVNRDNLYDDFVKLLEKGLCYNCNIKDRTITSIYIKNKNTIIYANDDLEGLKKYATKLGISYQNQSLVGLSSQYFKKIQDNEVKNKWEYSHFNHQISDIINSDLYKVGGKNFSRKFNKEENKSHREYEIDLYRCYTSIALEGEFYTINQNSDFEPYNTQLDNSYMYWVETRDDELFTGNGLYDFEMVDTGLKYKVILPSDIKYQLLVKKSPNNDNILKKFIQNVYKLKNDKYSKAMCNFLIGGFGKNYNCKYQNRYITTSDIEASYRYISSVNSATEATIKVLSSNKDNEIYYVESYNKSTLYGSNQLIRNTIVQRATAKIYTIMKEIEKMPTAKIIQVHTDCIRYAINTRKCKPYKTPKNPTFGDLRKQKIKDPTPIYIPSPSPKKIQKDIPRPINDPRYDELFPIDEKDGKEDYVKSTISIKKDNSHVYSDTEMSCPIFPLKTRNNQWNDLSHQEEINNIDNFDYTKILKYDRLFIQGKAGTGKSFLINKLYDHLINQDKKVFKMAFTNTASIKINGKTIHKTFGINDRGEPGRFDIVVKNCDYILLDEISMIGIDLWNIFALLPPHIKIYGFGDYRQLEPVEDIKIDYAQANFIKYIFNNNMIELQKQHRNDGEFANSMADYHDKKITFDELDIEVENELKDLPNINLCRTNKYRCGINKMKMLEHGKTSDKITNPPKYSEFTHLYKDMPIIFTKKQKKKRDKKCILTNLYNNQRFNILELNNNIIKLECFITKTTYDIKKINILVNFKPAYAITIHKAQGDTIDEPYAIHEFFNQNMNSRYTSLTRATSKDLIRIYS